MIHGLDESRFPSGNALFLKLKSRNILIDTNPGEEKINEFLRAEFSFGTREITDIILSHAHLDHGRGLARIYEKSGATIHGHPDTLKRCEKKARVGLYAGIPKRKISHFEAFGNSLGFQDRHYPSSSKNEIFDGQELKFDGASIMAHETNAHCLHMLDYQIKDRDTEFILSCDYDFTPIPWYGVPQRGLSITRFKQEATNLVNRKADFIISSHVLEPIPLNNQEAELRVYCDIIDGRTHGIISLFKKNNSMKLEDIQDFIYPIGKMKGKYSNDYIECARAWDYWLIISHLEDAWRLNEIKCVDASGDAFLEACMEAGKYEPELVNEILVQNWAEETLKENPPFSLPMESKWTRI